MDVEKQVASVPFPDDPGDGAQERHVVTLEVADVLSREELHDLARFGPGVLRWWLLWHGHGLAGITLPRGDVAWTRRLLLPAGQYSLGVGRDPVARRLIRFEVTSDGSFVPLPPPRTDAHECTS